MSRTGEFVDPISYGSVFLFSLFAIILFWTSPCFFRGQTKQHKHESGEFSKKAAPSVLCGLGLNRRLMTAIARPNLSTLPGVSY
jgi:hypothetical protein